jgi:hypothetical protein
MKADDEHKLAIFGSSHINAVPIPMLCVKRQVLFRLVGSRFEKLVQMLSNLQKTKI